MCDMNHTLVIWASHFPAGFVSLQLFSYEWCVMIGLLCIVDVRLMAKGACLHCCGEEEDEEKKPQGTAFLQRFRPLHSNSLRT